MKQEYLSEQDKKDIAFGVQNDVDYIACSFVSKKQDLIDVHNYLKELNADDIELIAKIENQSGFDNIEEICEECDGIMIARGDMGVEIPFKMLPAIQKKLITKCRLLGKRVITATEMLESMIHNPRPTRAEISDVANAVFDGTGAIMLSGETGVGKYPVETVRTMAKIAENAENNMKYHSGGAFEDVHLGGDEITNAIAHAVCATSEDLDAKCIVAFTESGFTANAVSCRKADKDIVGATPDISTFHKMALYWGVQPSLVKSPKSTTDLYMQAVRAAVETVDAKVDDVIVITAGMPVGRTPYTNTMRVMHVTQDYIDLAFEEE